MKIKRVGVDIGKNMFHLCAVDRTGKVIWRKALKRHEWLSELVLEVEPGIEVAMEACGGANHWARELIKRGFVAKLIAPQHVKPFRKSHKTDHADAEAITEAMSRPQMNFVPIKSAAQQDIQAVHRIRNELIKRRTALVNQVRGLYSEYGLVAPLGHAQLRRAISVWLDDPETGLSSLALQVLLEMREELIHISARIDEMDAHIERLSKEDPLAQRLQQLRGIGPVCATILSAQLGDGSSFKNGRDFAVSLGLTPRQHSTGGKEKLLGISKRGDGYIRKQMVHGARSAVTNAHRYEDPLSHWIQRLSVNKHVNVVVIALAAKTARMAWALAKREIDFDPTLAAAGIPPQLSAQ